MDFKITSKYKPTGDQPQAIKQLTEGVLDGTPAQGSHRFGKNLYRG